MLKRLLQPAGSTLQAALLQTPATRVSQLSNGLRVASQPLPGTWANVSLLIRAGPRHELPGFFGASHFLDRLSFKSAAGHSAQTVVSQLESIGGDMSCILNRDSMLYSSNVLLRDIDTALRLMANSCLRPEYTEDEIADVKAGLKTPGALASDRADIVVLDAVHQAAYHNSTYGHKLQCTPEMGANLTRDLLHEFRQQVVRPDTLVLSAAGIDHDVLVELAEKYFGAHVLPKATAPLTSTTPIYVGGECVIPSDQSLMHPALHTPLAHAIVALQAPAWGSKDSFAVSVLQALLGGGFSFSVGGPGKGMFSWFYTQILNMYHFIDQAQATHQSYPDAGLFLLQTSAPEDKCKTAISAMQRSMLLAAMEISNEELVRAKNQLKANIMHHLESKAVVAEDIARQIAASGHRLSEAEICAAIDAVTTEEVQRQVVKLLQSKPSIGVCGATKAPVTAEQLHHSATAALETMGFGK